MPKTPRCWGYSRSCQEGQIFEGEEDIAKMKESDAWFDSPDALAADVEEKAKAKPKAKADTTKT